MSEAEHSKSVQFGDRRDEAEAEPASRRAARRIRAIEALKDRRQVLRGDARPIVLDGQRDAMRRTLAGDEDSNALGRMPERVVEQIRDHLGHELLVSRHRQGRLETTGEPSAPFVGGGLESLDDIARDLRQIERLERRASRAGFDLADAQQRLERLEHAFDLDDRGVERASDCRGGGVARSRLFQATQDVGKRLAQVVRNVGADVPVGEEELLDPLEQTIERAREGGQVVVDRGQRNAAAPVAGHDAVRGEPHRIDPAQELRAEPETSGNSKYDGRADRPGESGQNAAQRLIRTPPLVADNEDRPVRKRGHQRAQNFGLVLRRFIVLGLVQHAPAGVQAAGARGGRVQISRQLFAVRA